MTLLLHQSLLSAFLVDVHAEKSSYFHTKINTTPNTRTLFKKFNSLLCPPPLTSYLTADDIANIFTNKTTTISSQFSNPVVNKIKVIKKTAPERNAHFRLHKQRIVCFFLFELFCLKVNISSFLYISLVCEEK